MLSFAALYDLPESNLSLYQLEAGAHAKYPALEGDVEVDVCIIGAGFTGLATARHLQKAGLSVIILEKAFVGFGASGRNGGQIIPGFEAITDNDSIIRAYGMDALRELWKLSVEGCEEVLENIEEYSIDCEYQKGAAIVAHTPAQISDLLRTAAFYAQFLEPSFKVHEGTAAQSLLGSSYYRLAVTEDIGAHMNPYKYVRGVAEGLASRGVRIFENSPVKDYDEDAMEVFTDQGRVKAKKIVFCSNAYLGRLVNPLRRRFVNVTARMVATEPLPAEIVKEILPQRHAVYEWRELLSYFRLTQSNRLVWGKETPGQVRKDYIRTISRVYPKLKHTFITHTWSGQIAYNTSLLPQIGRITPDIYYAHVYSGHGLNASHICAKLVAEHLSDTEKSRFNFLTGFKVPRYPGNIYFDRLAAKVGLGYYWLREKME